jgi:GMP synthase (glutamine-hydrolysing)
MGGDARAEHRCAGALSAVTSTDGMTADDCPFDHAFLGRVANRIINDARGINRRQANLPSRWRANILSARARSPFVFVGSQ